MLVKYYITLMFKHIPTKGFYNNGKLSIIIIILNDKQSL